MHSLISNFPPQQLPMSKKGESWRKKVVDWADNITSASFSPVRSTLRHKRINYNLLNGIIDASDFTSFINPDQVSADFIPEKVPHYPIINSKLNVLRGEESARPFNYKIVVTNPNAISEKERSKKEEAFQLLQQLVMSQTMNEEEKNQELERLAQYMHYEWQDLREVRCNALLNHYYKEYNIPLLFEKGFMDALCVGEEIYQCDIVGGEPIIEKLDPTEITVIKSGLSSRIEDADIVIKETYLSPGQIIDIYGDEYLSKEDIKKLEEDYSNNSWGESEMGEPDDRLNFIPKYDINDEGSISFWQDGMHRKSPYDINGNIRVMTVYWKSRRKVKKIKSFDPFTGEEKIDIYPETYIINEAMGEEEEILYINQAWEGTKIGKDIYVKMGPRSLQYNTLGNPSKCHFGIIGSVYNLNGDKPFSFVDMMKPFNYMYDAVHDRLNKLLARNWGKLIKLDLAKVPAGWDIDTWLYHARVNGLIVENSFNEGNGAAKGKIVGGLNNASTGTVDAELSSTISAHIQILEYIKQEMSDVVGITKQREGQISSRETVGGVERSTLQSTHITEWLFSTHNDIKKRALECFIETAKMALKGRNTKFQYILPDYTETIVDIEGDEFAEADYGLVLDISKNARLLEQKLDTLAQAALQNQTISFSTMMKLFSSSSLAEKQRMVERNEQEMQERAQQQQQQAMQQQQMALEAEQAKAAQEMELKNQELLMKEQQNIRDNETKVLIATINNDSSVELEKATLDREESVRQFNEKLKLDKEKLEFDKTKHTEDLQLKRTLGNKKNTR